VLEGREWRGVDGASAEALAALRAAAPRPLPESYFAFLSFSNGGEGPLAVQPLWLCLDSAEDVVTTHQSGRFQAYYPDLFVIGGNGAGEAIAFDLRTNPPYAVVAFDMTNSDLGESVIPIAASFEAALELIGHDQR
jgi:hypothetical protein